MKHPQKATKHEEHLKQMKEALTSFRRLLTDRTDLIKTRSGYVATCGYNSYCSLLRWATTVPHASAQRPAKPCNARSHSSYFAAAQIADATLLESLRCTATNPNDQGLGPANLFPRCLFSLRSFAVF
jgi:hypothetical protein